MYPQLTKVIKLSAKNNSVDEFKNVFEMAMVNEISRMPSLEEPFLPSWSLLKTRLQNMSENYIDAYAYTKLTEECGVEDDREVRESSKLYWDASEDERNTFVRDMLRTKNYYISDQTRSGKSSTGKRPGELDIEIRETADVPWTVYEALNITGFAKTSKDKWNEHLVRLLDNYNPVGYPFLFLVSYLECTKDRFKEIWLDYFEHLSTYSPPSYSLQLIRL